METFILVKAGMRNRKGIYMGIILLTAIITTALVMAIGVRRNVMYGITNAFDMQQTGDIMGIYRTNQNEEVFSQLIRAELEDHEWVDHLEWYPCLPANGMKFGTKKDSNSYFFMEFKDQVPVFNEDATGFVDSSTLEPLGAYEIYLPYGVHTVLGVNVGEKVQISFKMDYENVEEGASDQGEARIREFTVKGFVQEAFTGCSNIGSKCVYIGTDTFRELYKESEEYDIATIQRLADYYVVYTYPSKEADPSSNKVLRKLNLDLKYADRAEMTLTKETSIGYTAIYVDICMEVLSGFAIFLLVIYLIVACHNVGTEIDIDYGNIGILKSQGITNTKQRMVYCLQYMIAEGIGVVIGIIASVFLERKISNVFFQITAALPGKKVFVTEGILIGILLLLCTGVVIFINTHKVLKTSPVKAIKKENSDYTFDSRIQLPLSQKALDFTLGIRQITSAPGRYLGIVFITAMLVYMVITMQSMSGYIQSKNAMRAMGVPFDDLFISYNEEMPEGTIHSIEQIIEEYTPIAYKDYEVHFYVSVNGEAVLASVSGSIEDLATVYKGRNIKYPNEILITENISKLLDIGIGDTVKVGFFTKDQDYVVVGICQTMMDLGKTIVMSLDGYNLVSEPEEDGISYTLDDLYRYGFGLESTEYNDEIAKALKDKFGDKINVEVREYNGMDSNDEFMTIASNACAYTIYALSVIFALVSVFMVCTKAFIQERHNIGIAIAIGFSTRRVRMQFAFRFMIISFLGITIGAVIAQFRSARMLGEIFSMFGIPHVEMSIKAPSILIPAAVFAICYMVFGYMASRRVKKVSTRELITEE